MSSISPLRPNAEIGFVTTDGRVKLDPTFYRWITQQLVTRVGGVDAPTNIDLNDKIREMQVSSIDELRKIDVNKTQNTYLVSGGRSGAFSFEYGDYAQRVSDDAMSGVYVKSDFVSESSGCWVRSDFDGSTINYAWWNDSEQNGADQLSACLSFAATLDYSVVEIGGSQITLEKQVSITLTGGRKMVIRGGGIEAAQIIGNNTDGALKFTATERNAYLSVEDVLFVPGIDGAGYGLLYTGNPGGSQLERIVQVKNCNFAPLPTGSRTASWNTPIKILGAFRPYIFNVITGQGNSSTTKQDACINVDESYSPHIENCYLRGKAAIGLSHVSTLSNPEGLYVAKNKINGPDLCVDVQNDVDLEPEAWIIDNHMNGVIGNIRIGGVKFGWVRDNLLYCQSAQPSFVDVQILFGNGIEIKGNIYRQPYVENRRHVELGAVASGGGVIKGVTVADAAFQASTSIAPIYVGPSCTDIDVRIPTFPGSYDFASYPERLWEIDAAAGNVVIRKGEMEILADDSGLQGPIIRTLRDSLTPAVADSLGAHVDAGRNSAGEIVDYSLEKTTIEDPTDGVEESRRRYYTMTSGALLKQLEIGNGVQVGFPVGAGRGDGSLNVQSGYHIDGVAGVTGTFTNGTQTLTINGGIITGIS